MKYFKPIPFLVLISLMIPLNSCKSNKDWMAKAQDPNFLHRTIKKVTDIIVYDIFSPPVASRVYTYTSVAAYEVARHQDSTLVTLAGQLHGLTPAPEPEKGATYCFPLASVEAALRTARTLIFSEDMLDKFRDQIMDEFRATGMPDDVFDRSLAYGDQVADHIIGWSTKDNYKETRSSPKYSIRSTDSTWVPTPPAYMEAIEPHWMEIRTFVIDSSSEFRVKRPPKFSNAKGSTLYDLADDVRKLGDNLSPEQREIASFWDCNPFAMNVQGHVMFATKKISPGGHWMNIAHVACVKAHADFAHTAEAYARTAFSVADGFIACWDEKYRSEVIRPETYIDEYIDQNWRPLLQTPAFPEYVSAHSVISASAASALTSLFGDNFAFSDSTEREFGLAVREFKSFYDASDEAAISRVLGGIHYRTAAVAGVEMGRAIGSFIVDKVKTRRG